MMKNNFILLCFVLFSVFFYNSLANAGDSGKCSINENDLALTCENSKVENKSNHSSSDTLKNTNEKISIPENAPKIKLLMFYAYDCPHCHEALEWLPELENKFTNLAIEKYEIKKDAKNRQLFEETAKKNNITPSGVPTFFIGDRTFVGFFKDQTCSALTDEVKAITFGEKVCSCRKNEIRVPLLGTIQINQISLLNFSVILGLLDGLNPCAMWVLMFLLGLLAHTRSSKKVFMIGSIFIISSGVVYFAFMSAWFNLFSVIGFSKIITIILAIVAIIMGLINLKELFFFKSGISLMIPDSVKPKIASRIRNIINSKATVLSILATILLAMFVNFIELGCTIGLPAIFTKILADRNLATSTKYFYLVIYNVAYIVPLALIMAAFGLTMGHFKMTERHGKILKLISGLLMLLLGLIMLIKPEILMFT